MTRPTRLAYLTAAALVAALAGLAAADRDCLHGGTAREASTPVAGANRRAAHRAEELASRGYIVAAISHTYDAAAVDLGNGRVVEGRAPVRPIRAQRARIRAGVDLDRTGRSSAR